MPDKRQHRGRHPEDERLFAPAQHNRLRVAVRDYSWLLSRGYAEVSALKLVGDHFNLTIRQRTAVRRCSCSDWMLSARTATQTQPLSLPAASVGIDGYNLLITVESALSGGLLLVGRDGCCRDLASIHGTYRSVEETAPAITLIAEYVARFDWRRIDWYLDRPVSNSGRLKALMADLLEQRGFVGPDRTEWNIELVPDPDAVLAVYAGPIVTSDSVVLDRSAAWVNLAAALIRDRIPDAWLLDLRTE